MSNYFERNNSSKGSKGSKGSNILDRNLLARTNIDFENNHLPCYEIMNRALGLRGEDYKPYKKALWYSLTSIPARKIKVRFGDIKHDLRVHCAFPIPSGGGKKAIVSLMEKTFQDEYEVVKPSVFHPDQLIGKTKTKKDENGNEITTPIKGHLSNDLFVKDEAYKIFGSDRDKYKETRSYMNEALDPYGENELTKRNVDTPKGEELSYFPDNNTLLFFQPLRIDNDAVREGLIRRIITPYSRFEKKIRTKAYKKRAEPEEAMTQSEAREILREYTDSIREFQEGVDEITIDIQARPMFHKYHKSLIQQGFAHSQEGQQYTNMVDFSLQDTLLKFAGIQALSRKRNTINEDDLRRAFIDLTELYACKLDYITDHLFEDISYPSDLNIGGKTLQALRYLKEKGAVSKEESDISVGEFKDKVREIHNSANNDPHAYHDMRDAELIDMEQTGAHDTRVWLKVDPENLADSQENARHALMKNRHYHLAKQQIYGVRNPWDPQCPQDKLSSTGFKEFWSRLESSPQNPQKLAKEHLEAQ